MSDHDHNYLSTKGSGQAARDPLSGLAEVFGPVAAPVDGTATHPLEDLLELVKEIAAMPKPISYIVLDPLHVGGPEDDEDGLGRRYLRCSPEAVKGMPRRRASPPDGTLALLAISVYDIKDMPADWPGLGIDHARRTTDVDA